MTTPLAVPPPLIKWTGSKRSQAPRIARLAPPSHARYLEPFLGGGAVLYHLARPGTLATDLYPPLIGLWNLVQHHPQTLIRHYQEKWSELNHAGHDTYYRTRDRFNQSHDPLDLNLLLRTCVNGIVRFNAAGQFNNSLHVSRPGMHPDRFARIVTNWHHRLEEVSFQVADYRQSLDQAQPGDFAYLDPPYAGTRQRYHASTRFDPATLFDTLDQLNARGVHWALSYDGQRAGHDLSTPQPVPPHLYRHRLLLPSGLSPVAKVLNGPLQPVQEALYLNYDPPS